MSGFRRIVERISVRAYVHPRLEEAPEANLVRTFIPTLANIPFARKQTSARLDNAASLRNGSIGSRIELRVAFELSNVSPRLVHRNTMQISFI